MIILNDSFRRVNARGGRVGGTHELYPDAGRVVIPDNFDSRFNFTSTTTDPIVGFGVIRNAVNDIGNGQAGGWSDLGFDWENGISKWEVKSINITIEVESKSQFVRQPNILFDIESSVNGYRETLRTASSEFGLYRPLDFNVELRRAIDLWSNTTDNWESINQLIIWSDAMYPPKTHISTLSSLISVSGASTFFKDQVISRTANLLLDLQSSSVNTDIDVFGDWATSVNEWQNLSGTLWEIYTSRTITDTASSLISVSSDSSFFIDQLIKRTANVAIGLNANSTFFIDQIISKSASTSIKINANATSQVISFGSWVSTNTNWESTNNLWEIYTSGTISDSTDSSISINIIVSGFTDKIHAKSASSNISITTTATSDQDTIFSRSASVSFGISATGSSQITQAEWVSSVDWNHQQLIWEAYTSGIDTDTADANISISTVANGYIDTIHSRTASGGITISASATSDSDTIFTRSGVTSISIDAAATKTIILGWGTSTVLWSNYTTNWEAN